MHGMFRWTAALYGRFALLGAFVGSFSVSAAQAQESQPAQGESEAGPSEAARARARELYAEGQRHFEAGRFAEAEASFRAAFEQVQNPVVLLGVAAAQERQGRNAEAARTLRRYLVLRPDAPDRGAVEQRIATLDPTGATVEPERGRVRITSTPPGASIAVDGTETGQHTPAELELGPGEHAITLTLAGHMEASRSVTVVAGETGEVSFELTPEPAPSAGGEDVLGTENAAEESASAGPSDLVAPEPRGGADPSPAVWWTAAVSGVGLVTGTVFGFLALSAQSDFDAMPSQEAADRGETFALIADLGFGVALAAGATAIVLYALESSSQVGSGNASLRHLRAEECGRRRFGVSPWVGPTGGGATVVLSF
jgi:tetratricopeptide (TPR) repeat protein